MGIPTMNKKGNVIAELIIILVLLVTVGIVSFIGFKTFDDLNNIVQSDPEMSSEGKTLTSDLHSRYPALFDGAFMFLLVGLWIAAIIFSFMIDTHPVFLIFTLILIAIIMVIGANLSNTYETLINDDGFSAAASNFPMTNFVFSHLVETICVIGFSILFALFGKTRLA